MNISDKLIQQLINLTVNNNKKVDANTLNISDLVDVIDKINKEYNDNLHNLNISNDNIASDIKLIKLGLSPAISIGQFFDFLNKPENRTIKWIVRTSLFFFVSLIVFHYTHGDLYAFFKSLLEGILKHFHNSL